MNGTAGRGEMELYKYSHETHGGKNEVSSYCGDIDYRHRRVHRTGTYRTGRYYQCPARCSSTYQAGSANVHDNECGK